MAILARLRDDVAVGVNELAEEFKTSRVTIRRDLDALGDANLVRRVHGGAVRAGAAAAEPVPAAMRMHVGVVVPTASYYFPEILQSCKESLEARGIAMSVVSSNYDPVRERLICQNFEEAGVQAIIYAPSFVGSEKHTDLEPWLFSLATPVILLEREIVERASGKTIASVRTAYEKGWELGLRQFKNLGHSRVALVTHGLRQVGVDLAQKWAAAVRDAGFSEGDAPLIVEPRATRSPDPSVLDGLTDRIEQLDVTGIISHCDLATLDLIHTLTARGIRIPQDLSVIANEDQIAQLTHPTLSSISPVKRALGNTIARLARDAVRDAGTPIQHVFIEPTFTDRGSLTKRGEQSPPPPRRAR